MFITTNDRIVNLKNVSNINILEDRVVFNMNYGMEIEKRGNWKIISDYVYLDSRDEDDYNNIVAKLHMNKYIIDNFITHNNGYINKNEI